MKVMSSFITLEEHYLSHNIVGKANAVDLYAGFPKHIIRKLQSLSDKRISDMEKGDVSVQVLSHARLTTTPPICTEANDELALAISKNPDRLVGFAMLPIAEPKATAEELARCIQKLGFVGALIDNHLDGRFYDDEHFWPVFEKAQELDVPIYLHPTFASDPMLEHYKGNYPENVARALSAHGWGWLTETGLHILRLFAAGLFDRFPKLKIFIGHMGETLPFQLERCIAQAPGWGGWKRD
jgi:predicted TIM-barrel fold metal-dependent hydrolase